VLESRLPLRGELLGEPDEQVGARDEAADAAPVDGQDCHPLLRHHHLADDAARHRSLAAQVAGHFSA
jgi:hypothetical protein